MNESKNNPIQSDPEISENARDPWRCGECGSRKVSFKAWADSNTHEIISDTCSDDTSDQWCDGCEEHTDQIRESELMRDTIEPWWDHGTTEEDREVITGLKQDDYSQENDCQAFHEACNAWWNAKTNDEKIGIWRQATAPEE